jgi:hypothetical protein
LELATLAGIESKCVEPMLTHHMTKGRIIREKVDGKFVYLITAAASLPSAEPKNAPALLPDAPMQSVTYLAGEIPAFTSRQDELLIPSVRYISSEIRRTRMKLAKQEEMRAAVSFIRKDATTG